MKNDLGALENRLDNLPPGQVLKKGREIVQEIRDEVLKVVYGREMERLFEIAIIAVLANRHFLIRAPVGLGKTLFCEALAKAIGGKAAKKQFRPDMLPSELSGFEIYNQKTREFEIHHGPLFGANVFLADEINRATPKTQSALLEAMEERRLTIGKEEFQLEDPFLTLMTRNPIEHEGVWDLSEALLDRLFAQLIIKKIDEETSLKILADPDFWRGRKERIEKVKTVTNPKEIVSLRETIFSSGEIHVEPRVDDYIRRLVDATWEVKDREEGINLIEQGASPRGMLALKEAVIVGAFLSGSKFGDPKEHLPERLVVDILAHRIFMKRIYRDDPNRDLSPAGIIREIHRRVRYD